MYYIIPIYGLQGYFFQLFFQFFRNLGPIIAKQPVPCLITLNEMRFFSFNRKRFRESDNGKSEKVQNSPIIGLLKQKITSIDIAIEVENKDYPL